MTAPWRVAGKLFGTYRPRRLILMDAVAHGRTGQMAESSVPLLEKLVSVRVVFSLGALVLLAQLVTNGFDGFIANLFGVTSATVLAGAPGMFLILVTCYFLAERSRRRQVLRQLAPTIRITILAFLLIFFAIGNYLPFWPDAVSFQGLIYGVMPRDFDVSGGRILLSLVLLPVLLWMVVFGICSAYLIHNNSFGVAAKTVLDPVVNIWLAWSVAAYNSIGLYVTATNVTPSIVAFALTGALVATLISGWELRELFRQGVNFRHGPWGRPTPAVTESAR